MEYKQIKQIIENAALNAQIKDYEVYFVEDRDMSVGAYEGQIEKFDSAESSGICFRCIADGKIGYAATELFTEESLASLPVRAKENALLIENTDSDTFYGAGDTYREVETELAELADTKAYIDMALALEKACHDADSRVGEGTRASAGGYRAAIRLFNSNGLDVAAAYGYDLGMTAPVIRDNGDVNASFSLKIAPIDTVDPKETAEKAVKRAANKIGAVQQESGQMPVVFSNEQICTILDAFLSAFSADAAQKGLSLLAGKEGEVVAASCISITDDPFYADSPVKMPFDAEGVATYRKAIVENGVLKTLLHNRKTAKKAGVKTTANASKRSYADAISISPYCFYIEPGTVSFDELIAEAKDGVYITELKGLHAGANPVTGDFSIDSEGFAIKDGKLAQAVRSFTVAGNFFTMLKDIRMIDNRLDLDYPSGATVLGAPDVLVDNLMIAGK